MIEYLQGICGVNPCHTEMVKMKRKYDGLTLKQIEKFTIMGYFLEKKIKEDYSKTS